MLLVLVAADTTGPVGYCAYFSLDPQYLEI
jgi:hypothetical protein